MKKKMSWLFRYRYAKHPAVIWPLYDCKWHTVSLWMVLFLCGTQITACTWRYVLDLKKWKQTGWHLLARAASLWRFPECCISQQEVGNKKKKREPEQHPAKLMTFKAERRTHALCEWLLFCSFYFFLLQMSLCWIPLPTVFTSKCDAAASDEKTVSPVLLFLQHPEGLVAHPLMAAKVQPEMAKDGRPCGSHCWIDDCTTSAGLCWSGRPSCAGES